MSVSQSPDLPEGWVVVAGTKEKRYQKWFGDSYKVAEATAETSLEEVVAEIEREVASHEPVSAVQDTYGQENWAQIAAEVNANPEKFQDSKAVEQAQAAKDAQAAKSSPAKSETFTPYPAKSDETVVAPAAYPADNA